MLFREKFRPAMVREYWRESYPSRRCQNAQRLGANIAQYVCGQQHAGSCLVIWCLENTYLVVVTEGSSTFA